MGNMFVEGVDFKINESGTLSAIRQGLAENRDRVLYTEDPDGHTFEIPVTGRQAALDLVCGMWARDYPLQNWLGICIDTQLSIGCDTIELCHYSAIGGTPVTHQDRALRAIRNGQATIRTKEVSPPRYTVEWKNARDVSQSCDFGEIDPRSLL